MGRSTKLEVIERRNKVLDLKRRRPSITSTQIATELNITPKIASNDLTAIMNELTKNANKIEEIRALSLDISLRDIETLDNIINKEETDDRLRIQAINTKNNITKGMGWMTGHVGTTVNVNSVYNEWQQINNVCKEAVEEDAEEFELLKVSTKERKDRTDSQEGV